MEAGQRRRGTERGVVVWGGLISYRKSDASGKDARRYNYRTESLVKFSE